LDDIETISCYNEDISGYNADIGCYHEERNDNSKETCSGSAVVLTSRADELHRQLAEGWSSFELDMLQEKVECEKLEVEMAVARRPYLMYALRRGIAQQEAKRRRSPPRGLSPKKKRVFVSPHKTKASKEEKGSIIRQTIGRLLDQQLNENSYSRMLTSSPFIIGYTTSTNEHGDASPYRPPEQDRYINMISREGHRHSDVDRQVIYLMLDSGSNISTVPHVELLHNVRRLGLNAVPLFSANGERLRVHGVGELRWYCKDEDGIDTAFTISEVHWCPSVTANLLSPLKIRENHGGIHFPGRGDPYIEVLDERRFPLVSDPATSLTFLRMELELVGGFRVPYESNKDGSSGFGPTHLLSVSLEIQCSKDRTYLVPLSLHPRSRDSA
jgi:hypothetical protein